jgi:WD40 repeat protein
MCCRRWLLLLVVSLPAQAAVLAPAQGLKGQARVDAAGDALPDGALGRLGTLRLRHDGAPFASWTPDGKHLISVGADNALHLWSVADGRKVRSFSRPGLRFPSLSGLALRQARLRLLQAQGGGGVRGQMIAQQLGSAVSVAHSADGRWLACAGPKKDLSIWDTTGGMQPRRLEGQLFIALAFSPDAKLLAATELEGEEMIIRVWDWLARRPVWTLKPQAGSLPLALRFSPDGKYLAAREQLFIRMWSMANGKRVRLYPTQHEITDFVFSPDSKYLAAVTSNRYACIWETKSEEEVGTITLADFAIHSACFSADGLSLFTVSADGVFRQWTCRQAQELRKWDAPIAAAQALALAPDGKTLAAVSAEGVITLWDVTTGKEISMPRSPEARALAFTRPETLFLYSTEGEARWVDWASGKVRRRLARPSSKGAPYAVHARKRIQAWQEDDHLTLMDAESGKTLATVEGIEGLASMAFSPDGRRAAFAYNDETVRLWSLASGKQTRQLDSGPVALMAFSHDNKVLAILGGDQELHLWELATGEQRSAFQATQSEVRVLEYTPDDRYLVAACADESVRIWDALTGKQVRTLLGHFGPIEALAISPDSRRLASGGADGVVRVWDLHSGAEQRRLEGHQGPLSALAFAPDGKRLASASKDTTVLVWDLTAAPSKIAAVARPPLARHWEDLGRADATMAFRAMAELVGTPEETLTLLRARLPAEAPVTADHLDKLIGKLSHDSYTVREKATKELAKLEGRARRHLLKALASKLSGESAKRVQWLVELLDAPVREPGQLRAQRAVEVVEHIGTPAALELLDQWARGAPGARLTESAAAAGQRVRLRLKVP